MGTGSSGRLIGSSGCASLFDGWSPKRRRFTSFTREASITGSSLVVLNHLPGHFSVFAISTQRVSTGRRSLSCSCILLTSGVLNDVSVLGDVTRTTLYSFAPSRMRIEWPLGSVLDRTGVDPPSADRTASSAILTGAWRVLGFLENDKKMKNKSPLKKLRRGLGNFG